jgi:hypothetical protein
MNSISVNTFGNSPPPEGAEIIWFRRTNGAFETFDHEEGLVSYMIAELESEGYRTGTLYPLDGTHNDVNGELVLMVGSVVADPNDAWFSLDNFFYAINNII